MGRTYRRNDRFKKDRRDKNFKQSKKFKELKGGPGPFKSLIGLPTAPIEDDDTI
jgi:hypothetical protein